MSQRKPASHYSGALRTVTALLIVIWLVYHAGVQSIVDGVANVHPGLFAAAFLTMVMYNLLKAWNWRQLLGVLRVEPRRAYRRTLYCWFAGSFLGAVVPSTASTDALRALLAHTTFGNHLASHAASVVVLNAISLVAACALGFIAAAIMLMQSQLRGFFALAMLVLAIVIAVILAGYLILQYRRARFIATLRRTLFRWFRFRKAIRKFTGFLLVFDGMGFRFKPVFVVALLAVCLHAATLALVAAAAGVELNNIVWAVIVPLLAIIELVPMSVSGLGMVQVGYLYLLEPFGIAASHAFVISVLIALARLTINLTFGAAAFMVGARKVKVSDRVPPIP
jgi:uncharacterized protein (TIRG00374 family)